MARIVEMVGTSTAGNTTATYQNGAAVTVPAGEFWIPRSIRLAWTTSAVVGNRQASVIIASNFAVTYQQIMWLPTQAATLTRYYSAWEGASQSAAFAATSYAQTTLARDTYLPAGFTITPTDFAVIASPARFSFPVSSILSVDATTVVATTAIFGAADSFKGFTLTMGSSTAVITTNDDTTLTFAAWVGGTPAPADYYLQSDTVAMTVAYDQYAEMVV